jgi:hypothetical protein
VDTKQTDALMIATSNAQRPTSNTQSRTCQFSLGSWALEVGCWAFRSRNLKQPSPAPRSGQAMVEVIVGLVALLVLTAGLIQVASLTRAQTDALVQARELAGASAFMEVPISAYPEYIYEIEAGPDGRTYSGDDETTDADASAFNNDVVEQLVRDPDEWDVIDQLPSSPFSSLHDALTPATEFGLLKGEATVTVELLPAVRSLLYRADEIDVECDVWMTWTRGIY